MKVYFHEDFYDVYTSDPAAESGRMESIVEAIKADADFLIPIPATERQIAAVHSNEHISQVKQLGLYSISALAAGGATQTAQCGLEEPCFGLIRPPGHHASANSAWGFCYFNNMAIALENLKNQGRIETAYVLDIDMHFGDGTDNILKNSPYATVHNIRTENRDKYLDEIEEAMATCQADIIGISAGFDNHIDDWGGVLETEDYKTIASWVREAAHRNGGGYFALLEGGYNHAVLGVNALALLKGMADGSP